MQMIKALTLQNGTEKATGGVAVAALRRTGGFGPQSLPERWLEKKPMADLVSLGLLFFFSSSHFIALEEQVFVHVLSKETGLHQQHASASNHFFSVGRMRETSPCPCKIQGNARIEKWISFLFLGGHSNLG